MTDFLADFRTSALPGAATQTPKQPEAKAMPGHHGVRHRLGLEAAALRQQLTVLKRKQPRPRLRHLDRLFWMALRRWWPDWAGEEERAKVGDYRKNDGDHHSNRM